MQTLKVLKNAKRGILSFLLHYANRETKHVNFYKVKNKLLQKYGEHIGYDIQFIEGKKCWSCDGTGLYSKYDYYTKSFYKEWCWNCHEGWYKRPTWNILQRLKFGKYTFHQPFKRVYEKPEIETPIIEGYIDHNRTKYGGLAVFILCLIYENGYLKRFYNESGIGWRCYWWEPRNWVLNAIHIYKNGRNSYPARQLKEKLRKYFPPKPIVYDTEDLPF